MTRSLPAIVLLVLVLGVAGCSRGAESAVPDTSDITSEASASVDATVSIDDAGTDAAESTFSDSPAVSGTGPLDTGELDAIEAELEAIEAELSSMSMPSDGDFSDIEGALY